VYTLHFLPAQNLGLADFSDGLGRSFYLRLVLAGRGSRMDTATYAATAMLPQRVIGKLEHPLTPEADFQPFDLSEIAKKWVWRFYATGPCNDI